MIRLGYHVGPETVEQTALFCQILARLYECNWSREIFKFVVKFNYLRAYVSIFISTRKKEKYLDYK